MGAYIGSVGANIQTMNFTRCLPGMYDIKHIDVSSRCVFTNTIPTSPYRGAAGGQEGESACSNAWSMRRRASAASTR